ncbi:hypothetical protein [Methanocalculus sp.]|uniref:hypothetical protein n=1 Tax=Methanocalculus sp. TaxID=2004547 RepID=UPI0027204F71|nr:hypothetical protein [Methanocalculus sp.]MDO8841864.1 hypothetical protein [Methanocalculus sp.]
MVKMKTMYFEKKFGISIDDLKSTIEIDDVIEKKIGRALRVKKQESLLINHAGCVFSLKDYEIDKKIESLM